MSLTVMHTIMNTLHCLCLNPLAHFRKNTVMVVVCPTRSLEVDMVCTHWSHTMLDTDSIAIQERIFRVAGLSDDGHYPYRKP